MTIYGWIGGILSVSYNIPQIVHVYRVKQAEGISKLSLGLRMISYGLVIYHCYTLGDDAIMYTTITGFLQLVIMYGQLLWYGKKTENDPKDIELTVI